MKNKIFLFFVIFMSIFGIIGCSKSDSKPTIKFIFLPNESNAVRQDARLAFKEIIEEATGCPVEIKTSTDYNIAIESLISGKADMAYIGAEGYIIAHERNNAIVPIVTNSGASGTLSDSVYYSFIAVRKEDAKNYKTGDKFDLAKVKGKTVSFVATGSTSGFAIPAQILANTFGLDNTDELIQRKEFIANTLFAGSHQGSQVNLFRKDADVATFAIARTVRVYDLVEGAAWQTGSVYKVANEAVEPFGEFAGHEITIIQATPVLNAPIVMNSKTIPADLQKKIKDALISEKTANNPGVFKLSNSEKRGLFPKYSEKTKLVETNDAWYDQVRKLKN